MLNVAERMSLIQPSPTLEITALANQLKAEGKDIVGFGAGEPDFDTPEPIKEAAISALRAGATKYTPVAGTLSLRRAIADKLKRENRLDYSAEQIIVGTGGKQVLYNLMMALLNPGDEVIFAAPYWVSYFDMVKISGGSPKPIATSIDDQFVLKPEDLEKAINPKTRILILNSPSNPTGAAYTKEQTQAIAKVLENHPHVWIITDDIYERLVYDGLEFANIAMLAPQFKDRTIVVNGMSKAFSMTGWRLGYAAGPTPLIKAMGKLQGQSTSNPNSFAQAGGEYAISGHPEVEASIAKMSQAFIERRNYTYAKLSQVKGVSVFKPQGAFYIFPDISPLIQAPGIKKLLPQNNGSLSKSFCAYLLEKKQVALIPGIAFGYDSGFRMSYATSMENIEKGLPRIAEAVDELWKG